MAVCSILYQLATRPEQQEKMYKEIKEIMPDPNTPLTTKLLDQMEFLKAFVKEVLRCWRSKEVKNKFTWVFSEFILQ
jgi:cytochrome P450